MAEFHHTEKEADGCVQFVLTSVATCRNIRQVQLEGNREVSPKFRGDSKILDLRADSVIKEYFITAVHCEIPQSPKIW